MNIKEMIMKMEVKRIRKIKPMIIKETRKKDFTLNLSTLIFQVRYLKIKISEENSLEKF